MLKKLYRGLKPSEVTSLFDQKDHSLGNRFFHIIYCQVDLGSPQFIVITTKKLHKSAVVRNRIRRQLTEMIRLTFSRWTEGLRVAIVVKKVVFDVPERVWKDEFVRLMKKAGLP